MKANELRIGNYVAATNDHVEFPYVVTSKEIQLFEADPDRFMPIHVTEKWLLRLGLKGEISIDYAEDYDDFKPYSDDNIEIGIKNNEFYLIHVGANYREESMIYNTYDVKILYVHHLQNLYFDLSGKELTIKEHVK